MYSLLIADDESIIRQGLKCIIDWDSLSFTNIYEAANGIEALDAIMKYNPDVVLMDIRMPKLTGLELVKQVREHGYSGIVVIISGYSDFSYAKEAIALGVEYYLTKPVEEEELLDIMKKVIAKLEAEQAKEKLLSNYRDKAKDHILKEILTGNMSEVSFDLNDINIAAKQYQVIIYEKYSHKKDDICYSFEELLRVTNHDNSTFDSVQMDGKQVILLKGEYALSRFQGFLERYERKEKPQKGSPLDSIFIAYGSVVDSIEEISMSYKAALTLLSRRFFCAKHQHTLGYHELPAKNSKVFALTENVLNSYCDSLVNYLQASNRPMILELLKELETDLTCCEEDTSKIKLFLADMYLLIKEKIYHLYSNSSIPFRTNSIMIDAINQKYYLYEIIDLFVEQFDMIMKYIGTPSRESTIDSIVHYIKHNYMNNIKLETIAPLFGYNSSYLGKIFNKKTGLSFNSYVDTIRIRESQKLLKNEPLKVYEIAEKVGYQNVDYFHMKFKKYTGMSPAEYRKSQK